MHLQIDTSSPIPIRRPLTEQLEHVIEGGGSPREQALPSGRELAGFFDPNTITRAIEDLKRSGYRPLHPRPAAPESSAIQRAEPLQGAPRERAAEQ
jgi:hypothetical protein